MPRQPRPSKAGPQPQRAPVFYEDPDHPGHSRHQECFKRAGVSPKQTDLKRTQGPCWICDRAKYDLTIYQASMLMFDDIARVVEHLQLVSGAGFKLAQEVRGSTGHHIVDRADLERERPEHVRDFRKALADAQKVVGNPSGIGPENFLRTCITYSMAVGHIVGTDLDPRRQLLNDPTLHQTVDVSTIEVLAGRWMYISKVMRDRAAERKTLLQANRGKDLDDAAANLIKTFHPSPRLLSEAAVSYLAPGEQMSERDLENARLQEDRWYKRLKRQPEASDKDDSRG